MRSMMVDETTGRAGTGTSAAVERERRIEAVEDRVSELAGVLNGTAGALVDLVADALAGDLWAQWGVLSPAHWLAWKTGLSPGRARSVVRVARRRDELPVTMAALRAGELSVDQVELIVAHVPSAYDEAAVALARHTTVAQLRRVLPRYAWDPPGARPAEPDDPPTDDRPDPTGDDARRAQLSFDDDGTGRLSAHLPADEALIVEAALGAARADLRTRERDDTEGEGDGTRRRVDDADALVELARSYLQRGALDHPGRDRFLVLTHLDQHPDGTPVLRGHLGPVVPDVLRRLITCDTAVRPVFHTDGVALSVGRTQRVVPDRTRRIVEQRDGGCVIPGCGRTRGLDVHHIEHWEDGGATDTSNLCCVCRAHHRQHHLGVVGIAGNADVPGGLIVTDRWGRRLEPAGAPRPVDPARPPARTAADRGLPPITYRPPTGERLRADDVLLTPAPARAGPARYDPG